MACMCQPFMLQNIRTHSEVMVDVGHWCDPLHCWNVGTVK
jgi:hypothetical protein